MTTLAGSGELARAVEPQTRPAELDPEAERLIEERRARRTRRLDRSDRFATTLIAGSFLAVAVPLAALVPSGRSPAVWTVALLVATYAALALIRFDVRTGLAVPTQLVLVPMLFLLPVAWVPLCVAAGSLLASLVHSARGRLHPARLLLHLVNSWYALGPVVVLAAAGERPLDWSRWPVYVGALAAQFAFDLASPAARALLTGHVPARAHISSMAEVWLVDAALAPIGLLVAFAALDLPYAFLLTLPLVGLFAFFARERRTRIDHALELSHAYRGTALLLGDLVEADDAYTGSHSRDVVALVLAVADDLALDPRERRKAEFAALLHDIGKVHVPAEIINKPGPLTAEERAVMNMHTIEGERLLEQVGGLLAEVGHIVRSCHERFDGGGYPDGLAGEAIPLVARVVACCDAFNAMTTDRPYRRALPLEHALAELRANAGTQFDPRAVKALVAVVARG